MGQPVMRLVRRRYRKWFAALRQKIPSVSCSVNDKFPLNHAIVHRVECLGVPKVRRWNRSYGLSHVRWRGLVTAVIQVNLIAIADTLKRSLIIGNAMHYM